MTTEILQDILLAFVCIVLIWAINRMTQPPAEFRKPKNNQ